MNCVDVCPKGLNPTKAIGKIKEMMVRTAPSELNGTREALLDERGP
jgi:heterodisulfide reductase subunit C